MQGTLQMLVILSLLINRAANLLAPPACCGIARGSHCKCAYGRIWRVYYVRSARCPGCWHCAKRLQKPLAGG